MDKSIKHFTKVPNYGINITPDVLFVYTLIKSFIRSKSLTCYPSLETLKNLSGISVNTIKKHIKELEDKHYLKIERTKGSYNKYTFIDLKHFEPIDDDLLFNQDLRYKLKAYIIAILPFLNKKIKPFGYTEFANDEMSKLINMPTRTISKLNKELESMGYLQIVKSKNIGETGFKRNCKVFNLLAIGQEVIWQVAKNTEDIEVLRERVDNLEEINKKYKKYKEENEKLKQVIYRLVKENENNRVKDAHKLVNALKNRGRRKTNNRKD